MEYILGIQLVGLIFGGAFLYFTHISMKKNNLSRNEAGFWFFIWIGLIIASIFPQSLNFLVKDVLNVSRTLDFLIIIGFLTLFGIVYYIFTITKKTQNKVETLVRNLALKEEPYNEKKNN